MGWGLPLQRESEVDAWAKAWIRQHLDAGVRYHAVLNLNVSNAHLTGKEPALLATRCVTADGGFRGPRHTGVLGVVNGQPSWFHCVNNPAWKAQLKKQVGYAIAAGTHGKFDYAHNRVQKTDAFRIRFAVPEDWGNVQAIYHTPGNEPIPLTTQIAGGKAEVSIPSLEHWGLLSVSADNITAEGRSFGMRTR